MKRATNVGKSWPKFGSQLKINLVSGAHACVGMARIKLFDYMRVVETAGRASIRTQPSGSRHTAGG